MDEDHHTNSTLTMEEYQTPTTPTSPKSHMDERSQRNQQPSERDILTFNTQQLINDINNKRKRDSTLVLEFKSELDERARLAAEKMEETIHVVCGSSNTVLDAKLQEVYTVLDEIAKLEQELVNFKTAFAELYQTHVAN